MFTLSHRQHVPASNVFQVDPSFFECRGSIPGHASASHGSPPVNLSAGISCLWPASTSSKMPPLIKAMLILNKPASLILTKNSSLLLPWSPGPLVHQMSPISYLSLVTPRKLGYVWPGVGRNHFFPLPPRPKCHFHAIPCQLIALLHDLLQAGASPVRVRHLHRLHWP